MDAKKIVLAGLLGISPYLLSNYLVFVFLVPLLYLLYLPESIRVSRLSLLVVLASLAVLLPVVAYDAGVYLFGVLYVSFFLVLFFTISKFLVSRLRNPIFPLFVPCLVWTSLLYLINVRLLMTAAFDVGVLFPASAPLIWYIGSTGLTTLIILFNSAVGRFLAAKDKFSLAVACVLFAAFLGSFLFSMSKKPDGLHLSSRPVVLALIQGDVPRDSVFGYRENLDKRIGRYLRLSREAVRKKVNAVIWPEYTLPVDLMNRFPAKMRPILEGVKKAGVPFVVGSILGGEGKKNYNAALVFDETGNLSDIYYSQNPAIFNRDIVPRHNGDRLYVEKAGIALCWEELSEKIFRNYVKRGAEYFISLSSNTDLDYSWFKRYASFFSRARAAESMRYLARVTQTGLTQIVNPFGRVVERIPAGRAGFLAGKVYGIGKKTFYSRHGDVLTKLFIISLILAGLAGEVIAGRRRRL